MKRHTTLPHSIPSTTDPYDVGYQLGQKYRIWKNPNTNIDKITTTLVWGDLQSLTTYQHRQGFKDGYYNVPARKDFSMATKSLPSKKTLPSKDKKNTKQSAGGSKLPYINTVQFSGTLGKEPLASYTGTGKGIIKSSLALFIPGVGDEDNTMWFDLTYWLPDESDFEQDEVAVRFNDMVKGAKVVVTGRFTRRDFNDQYYYGVTVSDIVVNDTGSIHPF